MTQLLLALSISLDSLGIGISYGVKSIKIRKTALLIIIGLSILGLLLSWSIGQMLLVFISEVVAKIVSAGLLIIFGSVILLKANLDAKYPPNESEKTIKKIRIKPLSIVISIIREPSASDFDKSGEIDNYEALYLGVALSIDAFSIGIIVSLFELSILPFLLITAISNVGMLKIGEILGEKLEKMMDDRIIKLVSGAVMLIVGLVKLI